MPGKTDNAPFFSGGTPQASTQTAIAAGGGGPYLPQRELGKVYHSPDGRRWQKLQMSSVLTHAAALKEIIYWKDISAMIADTDLTDSVALENSCAGMLLNDTTTVLPVASQYFWALQEGTNLTASGIAVNFTAGCKIVPSTTVGKVTATAQGTGAVDNVIGGIHTAVDRSGGAGDVVIDLDVPSKLY